jgi:TonB family protein
MKLKMLLIILFVASIYNVPLADQSHTDTTSARAPTFTYDTNSSSSKGRLGGRSKESIMKVVLVNLPEMKRRYNQRLKERAGIVGKVTVKFAINEFGKVIFCTIASSDIKDSILNADVIEQVKLWQFEKLDKPGDVTEVVYPFIFDLKRNYSWVIFPIVLVAVMCFSLLMVGFASGQN